ncbi:transcriptional regulator [Paenibacillus pini JCM 16418]|uniref:Transcriptional regulator n=1 Tax=Paenibacillus pini JCM 16418 TaxID=1236976 RepID=W7YG28_9BACL|nr:transcriptional regulator [Paenibacillus pini JCM 16418]
MENTTLYRIGELAKAGSVSERTIDYYTKLGLVSPEKRTLKNYRLYSHETLARLKRINELKQEKYTLEEIKATLEKWDLVSEETQVSDKLTHLELHMQQLEREVRELSPLMRDMKPSQARHMLLNLLPQGAAVSKHFDSCWGKALSLNEALILKKAGGLKQHVHTYYYRLLIYTLGTIQGSRYFQKMV